MHWNYKSFQLNTLNLLLKGRGCSTVFLHVNSTNRYVLMFCEPLIKHSRDITTFNQSYSVIISAGRKEGCSLFKNKGEGGKLKAGGELQEGDRVMQCTLKWEELWERYPLSELETQEEMILVQYSPCWLRNCSNFHVFLLSVAECKGVLRGKPWDVIVSPSHFRKNVVPLVIRQRIP